MKLTTTGIISALCWSARIASASTAHILTYDPQSQPRHDPHSRTLSPVPARLLLAQRAGVEDYHRADIARDEVIDAINDYGVRDHMFTEQRDGSRRALILVEGAEGKELDSFRSAYTSVQVSPAPAAHASKGLFIDLIKQSDPRPLAALSDDAVLANIKETNNVVVNGDMFYLADSLADASAMFEKLAKSNEWSITALISPPVDHFTKQGKEEKFQWGTYEIPQRQTKRDRLPKEEPLTETHSFKPVQSFSAPISSFANNTTPLRGILPACFTSQSACESATRNCTDHGHCSKKYHDPDSLAPGGSTGLDCWSCQCKSTKSSDGKKTTVWGGPACQKKDVSVEFWLIALFTVGLVSLIGFAVGNLFSMGSEELPSVIGAGVSGPTARK
ncbi:putative endoplasmic reticulum membrane protein [Pseudocercospora fuligena]|uniref:Putative endoplasmic reticulum membrane protein n=1 Tax=Pseudocercospora fuligena TaxID=685502 RepID=A0A8H6RKF2_9PEZI|nr:putative endoplasmic reticulum membrane protein [Pseudocercospora fuligena]